MLKTGWIKLHRSLTEWEWYDDMNTRAVFIHLLLTVSIREQKWHGITVPRGGRIVSYPRLAEETFLSLSKVRTAIEHLEGTGEIARSSHGKFTVISIKNFDRYQGDDTEIAGYSQEDRREVAGSSQQYKKEKKEKKEKKDEKREESAPAEIPTLEEIREYCAQRSSVIKPEKFHSFYEACGWKRAGKPITDWKAVVRVWEAREGDFQKPEPPKTGLKESVSGTEDMTQEEIDTMNAYLSLVNTFRI